MVFSSLMLRVFEIRDSQPLFPGQNAMRARLSKNRTMEIEYSIVSVIQVKGHEGIAVEYALESESVCESGLYENVSHRF